MNAPWFDPNAYAWIPGTVFGVTAGLFGSLVGTLAPRGRSRGLIFALWTTLMFIAAGFLVTGIVAWVLKQPYGIWYGLGFPGLLGLILLGSLRGRIAEQYLQAELRKTSAKDL